MDFEVLTTEQVSGGGKRTTRRAMRAGINRRTVTLGKALSDALGLEPGNSYMVKLGHVGSDQAVIAKATSPEEHNATVVRGKTTSAIHAPGLAALLGVKKSVRGVAQMLDDGTVILPVGTWQKEAAFVAGVLRKKTTGQVADALVEGIATAALPPQDDEASSSPGQASAQE